MMLGFRAMERRVLFLGASSTPMPTPLRLARLGVNGEEAY